MAAAVETANKNVEKANKKRLQNDEAVKRAAAKKRKGEITSSAVVSHKEASNSQMGIKADVDAGLSNTLKAQRLATSAMTT